MKRGYNNEISKRNAHICEQNEIFELLEDEFHEIFLLNKEGFEILYKQIRDHLEVETWKGAITRFLKVSRSIIFNNFNPTGGCTCITSLYQL